MRGGAILPFALWMGLYLLVFAVVSRHVSDTYLATGIAALIALPIMAVLTVLFLAWRARQNVR